MRWAAKLYPRWWRERYAAEFDALLRDIRPCWTDLFDVLKGAAVMQVRTLSSYLKLAGAVLAACVMASFATSFASPPYVSSAVIRVTPASNEKTNGIDPRLPDSVNAAWQLVISRGSLSEIIQRRELNLYRSQRQREPLLDVITEMQGDIRIERVSSAAPLFSISFVYPDRRKAQAVVDLLTQRLAAGYQPRGSFQPAYDPLQGQFQIVQRATLPETALTPNRFRFLAWGLGLGIGLGMLCGVLAASLRWRARWTMKVLACGLAGYVITVIAVSHGWLPGWYTSNAVLRMLQPQDAGVEHFMTDAQVADWLQKNQPGILSDAALSEIVRQPAFDLYRPERARMPLGAVVEKMRRDIAVAPLPARSAITISFTYADRAKAQKVVMELVERFAGPWHKETVRRYLAMTAEGQKNNWPKNATVKVCRVEDHFDVDCMYVVALRSVGGPVQLLEQASFPENRWPSPEALALVGMALAMMLGALAFRGETGGRRTTARPATSGDPLQGQHRDQLDDPNGFLTVAVQ